MREEELLIALTSWLNDPVSGQQMVPIINTIIFEMLGPKQSYFIDPDDLKDIAKVNFLGFMRQILKNNLLPQNTFTFTLNNFVNDQLLRYIEIDKQKQEIATQIKQLMKEINVDLLTFSNTFTVQRDTILSIPRGDQQLHSFLFLYGSSFAEQYLTWLPTIEIGMAVNLNIMIHNLLKYLVANNSIRATPSSIVLNDYMLLAWHLNLVDAIDIAVMHGARLPGHSFFMGESQNLQNPPELRELLIKLTTVMPKILTINLPPMASTIPIADFPLTIQSEIIGVVDNQQKFSLELLQELAPDANIIMPLEPKVTTEIKETLVEHDSIQISLIEETLAPTISMTKPNKAPKVKSPALPPPPRTPIQIALEELNVVIQQLKADKFNDIATTNVALLPQITNALATKLNEKSKKKYELQNFIREINLPLQILFILLPKTSNQIHDEIVQKIMTQPAADFFSNSEINILDIATTPNNKTQLLGKNKSNNKWLEFQVDEYLNTLNTNPTQVSETNLSHPIYCSKHFKLAIQRRDIFDNPIWKHLIVNPDISLEEGTKFLIALHQFATTYDINLATLKYDKSIFAQIEKINNLELFKLAIQLFNTALHDLIALDAETLHKWIDSNDDFFDVLLQSISPEQLAKLQTKYDDNDMRPVDICLLNSVGNTSYTHKLDALLDSFKNKYDLLKPNPNGISIVNHALECSAYDYARKFISDSEVVLDNVTFRGDTVLHSWAQYAANQPNLFELLYSKLNRLDLKSKKNIHGKTFLHSLINNSKASEDSFLDVLTKVFGNQLLNIAPETALLTQDIDLFYALLFSIDLNKRNILTVTENKGWREPLDYIYNCITAFFMAVENRAEIKEKAFKALIFILHYASHDSIFVRAFKQQRFDFLLAYLHKRHKFEVNLESLTGLSLKSTNEIVKNHSLDEVPLLVEIFDPELDENPLIKSIRLHPSLSEAKSHIIAFRGKLWKNIYELAVNKNWSFEQLLPLLNRFIATIKKYGLNPNKADINSHTIVRTLIDINNAYVTKLLYEKLDLTIEPRDLFDCLSAKHKNNDNLKFIFSLYSEQGKKFDQPSIANLRISINTKHVINILRHAIFCNANIAVIELLIETLNTSTSSQDCLNDTSIFASILCSINQAKDPSAEYQMSFSYAYEIIRYLLTQPNFARTLLYVSLKDGSNCLRYLFPERHENQTEKQAYYDLMCLLFDNGCNLLNYDKFNQNIFHYCALNKVSSETIQFFIDEITSRYSQETVIDMLSNKNSANLTAKDIYEDETKLKNEGTTEARELLNAANIKLKTVASVVPQKPKVRLNFS